MKEKQPTHSSRLFETLRQLPFKSLREYLPTVGEGALDLIVTLFAMTLVARHYGQSGLGIYSYLISVYFIVGYLSDFGVSRYVQKEVALHAGEVEQQAAVAVAAFQATFWTGMLSAMLLVLSAFYDAAHTRIEEHVATYLIIGFTVPLRNINRLKTALLHGYGRHDEVAKLEAKKRLIFIGMLYFLLSIGILPSLLIISFFAAELSFAALAARKISLPSVKTLWGNLSPCRATLKTSSKLLFTNDAFGIALYLDYLILGIYVPSWYLGVYAEASILARLFLLIPTSIRPVLREKCCTLNAGKEYAGAARLFRKSAAVLFYLHSLFALYLLLHFPETLHTFFHMHGGEQLSFRIFSVILPGLLFFASIAPFEVLYEAEGQVDSLRKIVFTVSALNLVLNCYLVPFAYFFGAAGSTTIAMLVYFLLFARQLPQTCNLSTSSYFFAGACVYLLFTMAQAIKTGLWINIWLLPVVLFVLFSLIGFFDLDTETATTADFKKLTGGGLAHGKTE